MSNSKRKFLWMLAAAVALAALLALALPIWLPWALRPALSQFAIQYGSYERHGFGRFALTDLRYRKEKVELRADRVSGLLPGPWVWRRHRADPGAFLEINGWDLRLLTHAPTRAQETVQSAPGPVKSSSVFKLVEETRRVATVLRRWLPRADLRDGSISLPSERFLLPRVEWNGGVLAADVQSTTFAERATLTAKLPASGSWEFAARSDPLGIDATLAIDNGVPGVQVYGTGVWQSNQVVIAAGFARDGWLPEAASVSCEAFQVPASLLRLPGYREVTGTLTAGWTNQQFRVDLWAHAAPQDGSGLFPAGALLRLAGTTNWVRLEQADVRAPWLRAGVSEGVTVDFSGRLLSGPATVQVDVDLGKQPWFSGEGLLSGQVFLSQNGRWLPDAEFELTGSDLKRASLAVDHLAVSGSMKWPWLGIEKANLRFPEGGTAGAIAQANLATRSISNGVVHFSGKAGTQLLPPDFSYAHALLHVDFQGPIDCLRHRGLVQVDELILPKTSPLNVEIQWEGLASALDRFSGQLRAGLATLLMAGSGHGRAGEAGLRLEEWTLMDETEEVYRLAQPFGLSFKRDQGAHAPGWHMALEPFHWQGAHGDVRLEADIAWPAAGAFRGAANGLDAATLRPFLRQEPPRLAVDRFTLAGGWTNGSVLFTTEVAARLVAQRGLPVAAHVSAYSDGTSVTLKQFQVASESDTVISGQGTFPLRIEPNHQGQVLQIDENQALGLHAVTGPNPAFWKQVSEWTRVNLSEPRVELSVSGPVAAPAGTIVAQIAAVHPEALLTNRALPRLEDIRFKVDLTRGAARLEHLQLRVEDQAIVLTGWLPLGTNFATGWKKFFRWEHATGMVQVADAQIAPFAKFLPKTLSPQGVLNINLAVRPDLQLAGRLTVNEAATRPLPSLGVVDRLDTRLQFAGRRVQVETVTGLLGGEPFLLTGNIDFAQRRPATGLPRLELRLRGESIPLARQPDLILRSDLDIAISNRTNDHPVLSGTVELRDSVFLSDLRVLIPGRVAQPRQRPPYFSIDIEPFANWGLNLMVKGERFLKVRSPFFRGVVSTALKVEGTLKEPVALGDVNISSGVVHFPFANLDVTQGLVSLTSADPFHPQLFVTAGARTLGYDVKMEVTGKADAPVLQFSATPPLSSEQVLLMLTAGEVPQQSSTASTQQRANRLALFLGRNLLSEFSAGSGSADRLTLRSGEYLSEQGRQTYSLEYRLSPDWSIVGEYDRFGAFNADLKWRIYSR